MPVIKDSLRTENGSTVIEAACQMQSVGSVVIPQMLQQVSGLKPHTRLRLTADSATGTIVIQADK